MIINDDKKFFLRGKSLQLSFHDFTEACGVYEGVGNDLGTIALEIFWYGSKNRHE